MANLRTLRSFALRDMPIFCQSPFSSNDANLVTGVVDGPSPTSRRVLVVAANSLLRFVFDPGKTLSSSSRHCSRVWMLGATIEVYNKGAAIS
jgi:hypothetical protein